MKRSEKEHVVAELTERLRVSQALIVADYRGLTNSRARGVARPSSTSTAPASPW